MNLKHVSIFLVLFMSLFAGCKKDLTSGLGNNADPANQDADNWIHSIGGEDCTQGINPSLVYPYYREQVMKVHDKIVWEEPARAQFGEPYQNAILTIKDTALVPVLHFVPLLDPANDSLLSLMFLLSENEYHEFVIFKKANLLGHEASLFALDGLTGEWSVTGAALLDFMSIFSEVIFCTGDEGLVAQDRCGPAGVFQGIWDDLRHSNDCGGSGFSMDLYNFYRSVMNGIWLQGGTYPGSPGFGSTIWEPTGEGGGAGGSFSMPDPLGGTSLEEATSPLVCFTHYGALISHYHLTISLVEMEQVNESGSHTCPCHPLEDMEDCLREKDEFKALLMLANNPEMPEQIVEFVLEYASDSLAMDFAENAYQEIADNPSIWTEEHIAHLFDRYDALSHYIETSTEQVTEIQNGITIMETYLHPTQVVPASATPLGGSGPNPIGGPDLVSHTDRDYGFLDLVNQRDVIAPEPVQEGTMKALLYTATGINGMTSVASDYMDEFKNNPTDGTKYYHQALSYYVMNSTKMRNWLKEYGDDLNKALAANNGDINSINPIITDIRPVMNENKGLGILINDTQQTFMHLLDSWELDPATGEWNGRFMVNVTDNFGLDDDDARDYQYVPGFVAWWALQHRRGWHPFVTDIWFVVRLSGKI